MAIRTCNVGDSVSNFFGTLQAGDTARFAAGDHTQNQVCTCSASDVTFESAPGGRARFVGSGARMRFFGARQTVQNLSFATTGASELEFNGVDQHFFDNDVTNNWDNIRSYVKAPGFISRRNFFHQIGAPSPENGTFSIFAHAFYINSSATNFLSEDDHFYQVLGGYCYHFFSGTTSGTIRRARIEDSYFFVCSQGCSRVTVENAAFVWNRGSGGLPNETDGTPGLHPYKAMGGFESSGGSGATIRDSVSFTNVTGNFGGSGNVGSNAITSSVDLLGNGVLAQDPQFRNPAANDFTILNATAADFVGEVSQQNPPPDQPTGLTVSPGYDTVPFMSLNWADNDNTPPVAGYTVYRNGAALAGSYTSDYTDRAGLVSGTPYTYWVVANGMDGQTSNASASITQTAQNPPSNPAPDPITGLQVTPGYDSSSYLTVNWNVADGTPPVSVYFVYVDGNPVQYVTAPPYTYRGALLVPGQQVTVSVRARGTDGQDGPLAYSPPITVAGPPQTPGAPTGLTVTPGYDTSSFFTLDWDDKPGSLGYIVYATNPSGTTTTLYQPGAWDTATWDDFAWDTLVSSYTHRGASAGQVWTFQVSSIDPPGVESSKSAPKSATASGPTGGGNAPAQVTGLAGSAGYDSSPFITLTWTALPASPALSIYQLNVNGAVVPAFILPTANPTYTYRTNLLPGQTYSFQVRGIGIDGQQGALSAPPVDVVAIGPPGGGNPLKPTGLTVTPGYSGGPRMSLNWADNAEPTVTYKVFRSPGGQLATGLATSAYTDTTSLTPGLTYTYTVQAVLSDGRASPISDSVSAKAANTSVTARLKMRLGLKGRRTGTVVNPPPPPPPPPPSTALAIPPKAQIVSQTATSMAAFTQAAYLYDSIGVTVHPRTGAAYANPFGNIEDMAAIGLRHVRVEVLGSWWSTVYWYYRNLANMTLGYNAAIAGTQQPIFWSALVPGWTGTQPGNFGNDFPFSVEDFYDTMDGGRPHWNIPLSPRTQVPDGTTTPPDGFGGAATPNPWSYSDAEIPWKIIGAVLGPNEPGITDSLSTIKAWTAQMRSSLKGRSSIQAFDNHPAVTEAGLSSNVKVSQLPLVGPSVVNNDVADAIGDMSAGTNVADVGTQHPYHVALNPSQENITDFLTNTGRNYSGYYRSDPSKALPWVVTEGPGHITNGMNSATAAVNGFSHSGYWPAPEDVIAEYDVRTALLFFMRGIRRWYRFHLYDRSLDLTDAEQNFGIIDSQRNWKEQAFALRNLLSIIGFTEATNKRTVPYSISGFVSSGQNNHLAMYQGNGDGGVIPAGGTFHSNLHRLDSLLVQQTDTRFLLFLIDNRMLWQRELGNWSTTTPGTGSPSNLANVAAGRVAPATQSLTVTIPNASAVEIAQPTAGGKVTPEDGRTFTSLAINPSFQVAVSMAGKVKALRFTVP